MATYSELTKNYAPSDDTAPPLLEGPNVDIYSWSEAFVGNTLPFLRKLRDSTLSKAEYDLLHSIILNAETVWHL